MTSPAIAIAAKVDISLIDFCKRSIAFTSLCDHQAKARINERIRRLSMGNPGTEVNPEFATVLRVLRALGLRLPVVAIAILGEHLSDQIAKGDALPPC